MPVSLAQVNENSKAVEQNQSDAVDFQNCEIKGEQELIFFCARLNLTAEQKCGVKRLLEHPVDWDYVQKMALRQGVFPLVGRNLLQQFGVFLPAEIKKQLSCTFQNHTQHNLFQTFKLVEICQTLEAAGIPVLPFKGPTLAIRVYNNPALRQFADLDVLVQPKDFDQALKILSEKGYTAFNQINWVKRKSLFFDRKKDVGMENKEHNVRLELHWKLSGSHFSLPFEINELWERLEKINVGGAVLKTLPFKDLFVYLCLHGSRHGWERLSWVCDLHELIKIEKNANWEDLSLHAKKHGCEKVVELGLFLVNEFFGCEVDYPNWSRIKQDAAFKKAAAQIRNKMFAEDVTPTEISDWYLYHLMLKERKSDKLKLHLHYFIWYLKLALLPNSMDKEVFPLPRLFYPLYFILRPSRLFFSYLSAVKK